MSGLGSLRPNPMQAYTRGLRGGVMLASGDGAPIQLDAPRMILPPTSMMPGEYAGSIRDPMQGRMPTEPTGLFYEPEPPPREARQIVPPREAMIGDPRGGYPDNFGPPVYASDAPPAAPVMEAPSGPTGAADRRGMRVGQADRAQATSDSVIDWWNETVRPGGSPGGGGQSRGATVPDRNEPVADAASGVAPSYDDPGRPSAVRPEAAPPPGVTASAPSSPGAPSPRAAGERGGAVPTSDFPTPPRRPVDRTARLDMDTPEMAALKVQDAAAEDGAPSWALPIISAGLAMMASNNPSFLGAIGEGGMVGLQQMMEQRQRDLEEARYEREMEMTEREMASDEAYRAESLDIERAGLDQRAYEFEADRSDRAQRGSGGGGSAAPGGLTASQYRDMFMDSVAAVREEDFAGNMTEDEVLAEAERRTQAMLEFLTPPPAGYAAPDLSLF